MCSVSVCGCTCATKVGGKRGVAQLRSDTSAQKFPNKVKAGKGGMGKNKAHDSTEVFYTCQEVRIVFSHIHSVPRIGHRN